MTEKHLPTIEDNNIEVEVTEPERKGKTAMKKIISIIKKHPKGTVRIAIVVVLSMTFGVMFYQNKMADRKIDQLVAENEKLESQREAAEQKRYLRMEYETEQLMKELSESSDLTTYEYKYENKTTEESVRMSPIFGWDIPGTKNSVTIQYKGTINVGYDMDDIQYKVSKGDKCIYVKLPEAQILDNYINIEDTTCTYKNNILNPIKTDAVLDYFEVIEADELANAEADDIYTKANEQLKNVITSYLSVNQEYRVEFL